VKTSCARAPISGNNKLSSPVAIAVAAIPPTKIAATKAANTSQNPSSPRISSAGAELSFRIAVDKVKSPRLLISVKALFAFLFYAACILVQIEAQFALRLNSPG
jgi:hypothetical protein